MKPVPLIAAALLMTGCAVGPQYSRPALPAPAAFKELPPDSFKETKEWKAAQGGQLVPLPAKWWEAFGDPLLNQLEEEAAVGNQDLKLADARFRQARATIRLNQSSKFPTVSAGSSAGSTRISANRPYAPGTVPTAGDFSLPFDISWEPDLWGRIRKNIAAARDTARAAAADSAAAVLAIQAETAYDYFELRVADAQERLLNDTVTAYTQALELTRNRFEGGASPKSEVAQAQTQLEQTRAQSTDIGVQRAQFEHAIAILLGKAPSEFSIPTAVTPLRPPVIPVGVPSQLLERRPDIASAELRVMEANEQVGLTKIAFYPTVMLSAALGLEGTSLLNWFNWPSRFWAVGPSITQTIFDGGRRKAASESAAAAYDATVAQYRQTTLTAFQQVEDSLSALRILEKESGQQRDAVVSAHESLELFQNRYRGGVDNYLQVITAQTILLANQRDEIDIQRRRMDASVMLIKALGGGWDATKLPKL
jgi:NodT family efflux transporter outer membrane factor (OMF) lipoprotein